MFILENLKLVVILSALLYGFLFGQLISDVSFTNRRLSLWCSSRIAHTPIWSAGWLSMWKIFTANFFFSERFREIANWNNILRINRYKNRIFHIQNLKGRIKEEKERQGMVVEWIATKAFSPLLMMEVVSSASQGSLSMMSKAAVDPDPPTPDPDAIKMFVGQVPRSMEEVNFVIYMGLNICNEIGLACLFINPWKAVIQFSTYGTRS